MNRRKTLQTSFGAAAFGQLPAGMQPALAQGAAAAAPKVLSGGDGAKRPADGPATIMADEHFNVYDKTGPGMTHYKP